MKPTQLSLAQAPPLPTLHTLLPLRRRDPQRPAARLYHLAWIRHRDTSCTILQKLPLYRQDAVRRTLTVETPRGASLRRRPRPCSLRRPAGAPWHLGSSSPPRRRPTGRLYSGGPDGIVTFETPSEV